MWRLTRKRETTDIPNHTDKQKRQSNSFWFRIHIWPGLDVKWAAPVDQYNQNVIIYR